MAIFLWILWCPFQPSPDLDILTENRPGAGDLASGHLRLAFFAPSGSLERPRYPKNVQNDQGLNTAIPTADSVYQINL